MKPEDKLWFNSQIKSLLNRQYSQPMTAQERVKGGASALPVIGDAISGYDAYQSAKQGDYLGSVLNAVGLLPMIPGLAGVIKEYGKIPKKGLPQDIKNSMLRGANNLPGSNLYDAYGMLREDPYVKINKLKNSDYIGTYIAPWGSSGKDRYAIGDNVEELAKFMLAKKNISNAAIEKASKSKFDKSLLGQLNKEFGDVFSLGKSTQSGSIYYTHNPSGTKIRISDHDLPLHYEQPDINLNQSLTPDEQMAIIKEYLK